jgi:hypothetical protein
MTDLKEVLITMLVVGNLSFLPCSFGFNGFILIGGISLLWSVLLMLKIYAKVDIFDSVLFKKMGDSDGK